MNHQYEELIALIIFYPFFLVGLCGLDEYLKRRKLKDNVYPAYAKEDKNKPSIK